MSDPYDLQRFVDAQNPVLKQVYAELEAGSKEGHWMWFVFPQRKDLGQSSMSLRYGISSLDEAKAYLEHPLLGPRLRECTRLVVLAKRRTIDQIFGYPDNLKFLSSMTLFAQVTTKEDIFQSALEKYFGGVLDPASRFPK